MSQKRYVETVIVPQPWVRTALMIAQQRQQLHANHESSRPLSDGYEFIGLMGEIAFSLQYGLAVDLSDRAGGDGRVDFELRGRTFDVKTARKPYNLISEVGADVADVLVLAGIDGDKVTFHGWEKRATIKSAPTKTFGHDVLNHYIPAADLQCMTLLARGIESLKLRQN